MESRADKAVALRGELKYNCAQAVAVAYADLVDADPTTLFRICEGLGRGLGCTEGTCGAILGACTLAGLVNSDADLEHPATKGATNRLTAQIMDAFRERNGATSCHDLKGLDTHVVLRDCAGCVFDAAQIAEELLFSDK